MKNFEKYTRQYFMPPVECMDWAKKDHIDKAPIWCSVDLRDGNQALIPGCFRDRVSVPSHPDRT